MFQSHGNVREGFICPECHLDMSTIEMLQIHFEDVHMKQSSSTVKGLFSLAKQKIKSVQDNFSPIPIEQINNYAQYFSFDSNSSSKQDPGYKRSFNENFFQIRKEKHNQIEMETIRLLVRLAQLINTNEDVPKNANTKERRKFEQDIVEWIDDSKVSLCPSCAKPFGLSRRKHHCRLDGFVICNQCSQFLPFSTARYLIEPNSSSTNKTSSNGVALQRSNSLTSLTSTATGEDLGVHTKDGTNNEDYLRICLSCRQILQRRYDRLCFKNAERDEVFLCYEKIIAARSELNSILPIYLMIIESLLSGDTKHQIIDAQKLYRRIASCYEKIDATSKYISQLAESCPNIDENDTPSQIRYCALCRNIRTYAIHLLQNYAITTRRVPSEDDIKQAREERKRLVDEKNESERLVRVELASRITSMDSPTRVKKDVEGWRPTIDRDLLEQTHELPPLVQQVYQVTEYIRLAEIAGRHDEVESLKLNLKVLEQALNNNEKHNNRSTTDSQ